MAFNKIKMPQVEGLVEFVDTMTVDRVVGVQKIKSSVIGDVIRINKPNNVNLDASMIGFTVVDARSATALGANGDSSKIPNSGNATLDHTVLGLFNTNWNGIDQAWGTSIIAKGWNANYAAWSISGYADGNNIEYDFYVRQSNPLTGDWYAPRKIWTDKHFTQANIDNWNSLGANLNLQQVTDNGHRHTKALIKGWNFSDGNTPNIVRDFEDYTGGIGRHIFTTKAANEEWGLSAYGNGGYIHDYAFTHTDGTPVGISFNRGGTIRTNNIEIGFNAGYQAISSNYDIGLLTLDHQYAQRLLTGGLMASDNYSDSSKIPLNGIYSKGAIVQRSDIAIGEQAGLLRMTRQSAGLVGFLGDDNGWADIQGKIIYSNGYGNSIEWDRKLGNRGGWQVADTAATYPLSVTQWATSTGGFVETYGTSLHLIGDNPWYVRLDIATGGSIELWQGINSTTMVNQGIIPLIQRGVINWDSNNLSQTLVNQLTNAIIGTNNSATAQNFNFAIGYDGVNNFIQSHGGVELKLNPLGNPVTINNVRISNENIYSGDITATSGDRTVTFDNIINYGQALRINANANLGINLQANAVTKLHIGYQYSEFYQDVYVSNGGMIYTSNHGRSTDWWNVFSDAMRTGLGHPTVDGYQAWERGFSWMNGAAVGLGQFPNWTGAIIAFGNADHKSQLLANKNRLLFRTNHGANDNDDFREVWTEKNLIDPATQTWVDSDFARKIGDYQGMKVGNSTNWGGIPYVDIANATPNYFITGSGNGQWNYSSYAQVADHLAVYLNTDRAIIRDGGANYNNASGVGAGNGYVNRVLFDYNWANRGYAGSMISFGGFSGQYQTELFGEYGNGGNRLGFRTRNDDIQQWNPARWLWHDGNFDPDQKANIYGSNLQNIANWQNELGVGQWNQYDGSTTVQVPYLGLLYDSSVNKWRPSGNDVYRNWLDVYSIAQIDAFSANKANIDGTNLTNIPNWKSVLGISTALALNFQQVTDNGAITNRTITVKGTVIDDRAFFNANPFYFLTDAGSAQSIAVGGLVVSNSYADLNAIPSNGIFARGAIATTSRFIIDGNDTDYKAVQWSTNGVIRWYLATDPNGEGGGNTGSPLSLYRYSDSGAYLGQVLSISRETGLVRFADNITTNTHYGSAEWKLAYERSGTLGNYVLKTGDIITGSIIANDDVAFGLGTGNRWGIKYDATYGGINFVRWGITDGVVFIGDNERIGFGTTNPQTKVHTVGNNYTEGYTGSMYGMTIMQSTGTGHGVSLYGTSVDAGYNPDYGIMFAQTANYGTIGTTSGDWATYFTMQGGTNRGWIFRHKVVGNVLGINGDGRVSTLYDLTSQDWAYAYRYGLMSRGEGFVNSIDANNIAINSEMYAVETANGTGNTNFADDRNQAYGTFIRNNTRTFTTDFFNINGGDMYFRTFYSVNQGSNPWRRIWDDVSLPEATIEALLAMNPNPTWQDTLSNGAVATGLPIFQRGAGTKFSIKDHSNGLQESYFNFTDINNSERAYQGFGSSFDENYTFFLTDKGGNKFQWFVGGWVMDVTANSINHWKTTNMYADLMMQNNVWIYANGSNSYNWSQAYNWGDHRKYFPNQGIQQYLGAQYPVYGGSPTPADFVSGSLALAMGNGITPQGHWNDILWLSSYEGGDVPLTTAIVSSKGDGRIGYVKQDFSSSSWGTFHEFITTDNFGAGLDWDGDKLNVIGGGGGVTSLAPASNPANTIGGDIKLWVSGNANLNVSYPNKQFTIDVPHYSGGTGVNVAGNVISQVMSSSGSGNVVTSVQQTTNGFQVNYGTITANIPTATTTIVGGVKDGNGVNIAADGTLSVNVGSSGSGNVITSIQQTATGISYTMSSLSVGVTAISLNLANAEGLINTGSATVTSAGTFALAFSTGYSLVKPADRTLLSKLERLGKTANYTSSSTAILNTSANDGLVEYKRIYNTGFSCALVTVRTDNPVVGDKIIIQGTQCDVTIRGALGAYTLRTTRGSTSSYNHIQSCLTNGVCLFAFVYCDDGCWLMTAAECWGQF